MRTKAPCFVSGCSKIKIDNVRTNGEKLKLMPPLIAAYISR